MQWPGVAKLGESEIGTSSRGEKGGISGGNGLLRGDMGIARAGRKLERRPSSIKRAALENDIPIFLDVNERCALMKVKVRKLRGNKNTTKVSEEELLSSAKRYAGDLTRRTRGGLARVSLMEEESPSKGAIVLKSFKKSIQKDIFRNIGRKF